MLAGYGDLPRCPGTSSRRSRHTSTASLSRRAASAGRGRRSRSRSRAACSRRTVVVAADPQRPRRAVARAVDRQRASSRADRRSRALLAWLALRRVLRPLVRLGRAVEDRSPKPAAVLGRRRCKPSSTRCARAQRVHAAAGRAARGAAPLHRQRGAPAAHAAHAARRRRPTRCAPAATTTPGGAPRDRRDDAPDHAPHQPAAQPGAGRTARHPPQRDRSTRRRWRATSSSSTARSRSSAASTWRSKSTPSGDCGARRRRCRAAARPDREPGRQRGALHARRRDRHRERAAR